MTCMKKHFMAFSMIMLSVDALATEMPEVSWNGSVEAGILITGGNTEISTISVKFDANKEVEKWRHNVRAEAMASSDHNVKTADRRLASGKSDYKITDKDYAFGLLAYERDRFSGYEFQSAITAGYGRRLLDEEAMKLDVEIGRGVRTSQIDMRIDPNAPVTHKAFTRLAAKYSWRLSENARFAEELVSEIAQGQTISKSVTGLQANINSSLAMKLTVTVKHASSVPVGTKETDRETLMTLVYSF